MTIPLCKLSTTLRVQSRSGGRKECKQLPNSKDCASIVPLARESAFNIKDDANEKLEYWSRIVGK